MTEEEAKKQFPFYEKIVFNKNLSKEFKISYLAITKKNYDFDTNSGFLVNDDYIIEIGFTHKKPLELDHLNTKKDAIDNFFESITKKVNKVIPRKIIDNEEPTKKEVQQAKLQNIRAVERDPFRTKLSKPNGGCSTASNRLENISGTIGLAFTLEKKKKIYFISNFHVLAGFKSILYDSVLHPSRPDTESVGPEEFYNPIGTLYWYKICQTTDAAICEVNSENQISDGIRCDDSLKIKGIGKPKIGMRVIKCGRSSGLTKGIIRSVQCSVLIEDFKISPKGRRVFKDQILTDCISIPGDSGSILLSEKGEPIGLLFAGDEENSSFHNKLTNIFDSKPFFCNGIKMPELKLNKFL